MKVAVGVIDVKNYYIETVADVAERIRKCLQLCAGGKIIGGSGLRI
jgi:5-methyltetrahydropteroyltriglutamate--homocysteine methyltransferase